MAGRPVWLRKAEASPAVHSAGGAGASTVRWINSAREAVADVVAPAGMAAARAARDGVTCLLLLLGMVVKMGRRQAGGRTLAARACPWLSARCSPNGTLSPIRVAVVRIAG